MPTNVESSTESWCKLTLNLVPWKSIMRINPLWFIVTAFAVSAHCAADGEQAKESEAAVEGSEQKIPYVTTASFEAEVLQSELPVLVDFTATWCVPCKIVDPIIESLMPEMSGRAAVFKLDIDESPEIYQRYQVNGVPHILFFNDGKEQDRISSPQKREIYIAYLESMIDGASALEVTMKLLEQDAFRRHFILTKEIENVENALESSPKLLTTSFENGQTPLSLILNRPSVRQDQLIEMALAQGATPSTHDLVGLGRCEEFKTALASDPEAVNRFDPDGNVPLITAMSRSHRLDGNDCVRVVLESGADLSIANSSQASLGRTVVLLNNDDLLKEFLSRGWDPEPRDSNGRNALHWAAMYGYLSNIRILLEHGADPSIETTDGETAEDIVRRARDRRLQAYEQDKDKIAPEHLEAIEQGLQEFNTLLALFEEQES